MGAISDLSDVRDDIDRAPGCSGSTRSGTALNDREGTSSKRLLREISSRGREEKDRLLDPKLLIEGVENLVGSDKTVEVVTTEEG